MEYLGTKTAFETLLAIYSWWPEGTGPNKHIIL